MENQITIPLEHTFDELLSFISPLDDQRLNRVPFSGSWTVFR